MSTGSNLIAQYFEIREVGKTIKSTKKQYVWRFKLDTKDYTIEMFSSVLSGKKKILQNGQVIFQDSKFKSAFLFPWHIGKNALSIVQHGDKFELRINNQSFTHLWDNERTKRNFSYEGGLSRPPTESVGGTDYTKPKDYFQQQQQQQQQKPQTSHQSERERPGVGVKSVTIAAPAKPSSSSRATQQQSSHHHERGHGYDDQEQSDSKFSIPPEIAAAMDPQELAMQIQMMEEFARKQKRKEERESKVQTSSAGAKNTSSKKQREEQEAPNGSKPAGFVHGFDRFEGQEQKKQEEKKSRSDKRKQEVPKDDFFGGVNHHQDNQGGAAGGFDFDFGGAQPQHQQQPKPAEKPQASGANNIADLLDLLSFDAPTTTAPQAAPLQTIPTQPQGGSDIFGGINLSLNQPQPKPSDLFGMGSAEDKPKNSGGFVPNLSSFMTAQPQMSNMGMAGMGNMGAMGGMTPQQMMMMNMMQQQQQNPQQQMMMQQQFMNQYNTAMPGGQQLGGFDQMNMGMGPMGGMGNNMNMMGNMGGDMQSQQYGAYNTALNPQSMAAQSQAQTGFDLFSSGQQQQAPPQQQYQQFQTAVPSKPAPSNDLFSDLSAYSHGMGFSAAAPAQARQQPAPQQQQQQQWGQPAPSQQQQSNDFLQMNSYGGGFSGAQNQSPQQQQPAAMNAYSGGGNYATHQPVAAAASVSTPFDDLF